MVANSLKLEVPPLSLLSKTLSSESRVIVECERGESRHQMNSFIISSPQNIGKKEKGVGRQMT